MERVNRMNKILFLMSMVLSITVKKLPSSAKEALLTARRNGYELAIATGRAPFMIESLLEELEIDTYVTFNGQYVVYKGEVVYTNGIAKDELAKIIAFGEARNEPVVFLDDKRMIASVGDHPMVAESLDTLKYPYPELDSSYYMQNNVYQTLILWKKKMNLYIMKHSRMFNLYVGIHILVIFCQKEVRRPLVLRRCLRKWASLYKMPLLLVMA